MIGIFSAALLAFEILPGTTPWNFPQDIVAEQYREMIGFYERQIAEAAARRHTFWEPAGAEAIERNRAEFRRLIGAMDTFLPPQPERRLLGDAGAYTVSLVSWPLLRLGNEGSTSGSSGALVREYGLLLLPKPAVRRPAVIAVPDATHSAADLAGSTARLPAVDQSARRLALAGYVVFAPFFTQRRAFSEPWTDDRAWLFRLAYQVGHHLVGSEVRQVSAARDFLATLPEVDPARIAVAGAGQGGLTALYAAALDTRLAAALVADYFDNRSRAFDEPEDRTVWSLLVRFGDAEIARMAAPRPLAVSGGGPRVRDEFARIQSSSARLLSGQGIHEAALAWLAGVLRPPAASSAPASPVRMDADDVAAIANAQFSAWQARYRNLAMEAYAGRDARWPLDTTSIEAYRRSVQPKLEAYLDMIGRYPAPSGPLEARSVQVYDQPAFTGYRLSVRVYDGVHAYGILLVPKGIRPGERRPCVFTQHGFSSNPEEALGMADTPGARIYSRFGARLAERGYVVFAPMIFTQSGPGRMQLARHAHLLGEIPLGLEVKKFGRVLDYLSTLPFIDPNRFAFYGLSYGGYTALWTGPAEPRFRVIICSGHFNDWDLKTTDLTEGTSFLFYKESFDQFNFDLLRAFNHSDLATLVAPRPFMVEIGDQDGVVMRPRRFVDLEIQRVLDLYRRLGIPERAGVAAFHGPHMVDGAETFPFLDRWLHWTPAR
ncbi:MAG TPA: prolyl oligopeptidase family serine peptidase [Bryobacteraceae bacterium]|nr:prolyl oligopeptidase family serine peptidase [Bryobacteraceae bacterium]